MSISKQSIRAIAQPQENGNGKLKERIAEFARMFEKNHIRKPMNMIETLMLSRQEGNTIISSREFDFLPDAVNEATGSIKMWTGTLIVIQREGRQFGEQITTSSDLYNPFNLHFTVPKEHRDKTGGCMVLEHPDFEFLLVGSDTYQVIPMNGIPQYVPGFPVGGGVFRFEREFGLPIGEKTTEMDIQTFMKTRKKPVDAKYADWKALVEAEFEAERSKTRILSTEYGAYIGLVVRDLNGRRSIHTSVRPSEKLRSFVHVSITPENYIEHIVARLQTPGGDQDIKRFIYDWMGSDPVLAAGINRARLNRLIEKD